MAKHLTALAVALTLASTMATAEDAPTGAQHSVRVPGSSYEIALDQVASAPRALAVDPALLSAIMGWLSSSYDLPASPAAPKVTFVPSKTMAALRLASSDGRVSAAGAAVLNQAGADFVSLYDDEDRIIYLPMGWSGRDPEELSMLVHETVHHLQNMAGQTFACPEAREKLAYQAQQDWLALFGRDFFEAFETDPFSLLVRTECPL